MRLYLKCKKCGKQFFSGLDVPMPGTKLSGNKHQCPHCKAMETYEQDDYGPEKP